MNIRRWFRNPVIWNIIGTGFAASWFLKNWIWHATVLADALFLYFVIATQGVSIALFVKKKREVSFVEAEKEREFVELFERIDKQKEMYEKGKQRVQLFFELMNQVSDIIDNVHVLEERKKKLQDIKFEDKKSGFEALDHMSVSISRIVETVRLVEDSSNESKLVAESVQSAFEGVVRQIEEINHNSVVSTENIHKLSHMSDEIEMITKSINLIAKRINLLALNASIEASRGGEHGKGFSVVATEIRRLGELSAQSTKQITDIVKNTQKNMKTVVERLEMNQKEIEKGKALLDSSKDSFLGLLDSAKLISEQISNVTLASVIASKISEFIYEVMTDISEEDEESIEIEKNNQERRKMLEAFIEQHENTKQMYES